MGGAAPAYLYDAALGPAMERVAGPVRALHRFDRAARFAGRASVVRGRNPLVRLVAGVMGLPRAQGDCTVEVLMTRDANGVETWQRTFGAERFSSTQELGRGRWAGLVVERFGPMAFAMEAVEEGGRLRVVPRAWSAFGVPMPRFLGPHADAFEHDADGRFNFDVAMSLPVIGLVVHYRGWLAPVDA